MESNYPWEIFFLAAVDFAGTHSTNSCRIYHPDNVNNVYPPIINQRSVLMKKFMAVFTGSQTSPGHARWKAMDEAKRKETEKAGMQAWMKWGEANAKAAVEHGGPLGKTKRIATDGISDISNNLAGFTIVQAESHEAA